MEVLWRILCISSFLWMNIAAQKHHRLWERGFSDQYKSENNLGHYAFGYNEDHTSGGSFRREIGDRYGNKIGSYGLRISDGRIRIVNYIADHNGYRADVVSNEPGISSQKYSNNLEVTKKSLQGITIPGFSYSADAPHVTFSSGAVETEEPMTQKVELTWDDSDQDPNLSRDEFYAQATAPDATEAESAYVTEVAPTVTEEQGNAEAGGFIDDSKLPSDVSVTVAETESSPVTTGNTTQIDLDIAA